MGISLAPLVGVVAEQVSQDATTITFPKVIKERKGVRMRIIVGVLLLEMLDSIYGRIG